MGVARVGSLLASSLSAAPAAPQASWTVMVYMSGDNNLEDGIAKDIGSATVLWEGRTGAYAHVHGVTIYRIARPTGKDSNRMNYRSTPDSVQATCGDEFLGAYAR